MKKLILPMIIVLSVGSSIFFGGCYPDTVDSFSTFSFQFPILFHADYQERMSPDTNWDFVNLYEYQEYSDNVDKINVAELISFNYWIDSLTFVPPDETDTTIFDNENPDHEDLIKFDYIKFTLVFAKPKGGLPSWYDRKDSSNYEINPDIEPQVLGTFYDVEVEDYYRYSHHIEEIEEKVAQVIEHAMKENPHFYIETEYSKLSGQETGEKWRFPQINARYDMVIRLDIDL